VHTDSIGFLEEAGAFLAADEAEMQEWTDLLTNIWNTTPQPDRGGLTALELFRQGRRPKGG
jgi:hypothetical protein